MTPQEKSNIEAEIDALTQKIYAASDRRCRPLYPWVLLQVLPREQQRGGIILPGSEQNKTIHEARVIQTWQPFWQIRKAKGQSTQRTWRTCDLSTGDHVLFQHFAGVPFTTHKDSRYRFVKYDDFGHDKEGGILAVLDYAAQDFVKATLTNFISQRTFPSLGQHHAMQVLVDELMARFTLLDNNQTSVTLSGV